MKNKEKILFVSSVGGFLHKFDSDNVRILQEMGYEVHYASNVNNVYQQEDDTYQEMKVKFHDIGIEQSPFRVIANCRAFSRLIHIMRNEGIKAIHCSTPTGGLIGRIAAMCRGRGEIKVMYTAHGFHFYQGCNKIQYFIYHTIEVGLARMTDALVTINREDYEAACKMKLKKNGHVHYIPSVGINMEQFHLTTDADRKKARENLKIGESTFLVLTVGEIRKNKNQVIILRAIAYLKKRGIDISQIRYGVVGCEKKGSFMLQLARKLGVEKNLILYGYQKDVVKYLQASDLFAFPSYREGLGMAAVEALATGLPVLGSDNRGTREYLRHGVNGLVYQPEDMEGFASGILCKYMNKNQWNKNQDVKMSMRSSVERFEKTHTNAVMKEIYEATLY